MMHSVILPLAGMRDKIPRSTSFVFTAEVSRFPIITSKTRSYVQERKIR